MKWGRMSLNRVMITDSPTESCQSFAGLVTDHESRTKVFWKVECSNVQVTQCFFLFE